MKSIKGITLISLVITIILLIIIAGIGISLSIGENGLLNKSKLAKQSYINSEKEEEKQINDLYSQMLIATNDDAKVTISVKDLKQLINETVDSKLQSKGTYIDTTKKIADLQMGVEYEASQDCVIMGYIQTNLNAARSVVAINIDGTVVGYIGGTSGSTVYDTVNLNIRKGQKVLFDTNVGKSSDNAIHIAAYEML